MEPFWIAIPPKPQPVLIASLGRYNLIPSKSRMPRQGNTATEISTMLSYSEQLYLINHILINTSQAGSLPPSKIWFLCLFQHSLSQSILLPYLSLDRFPTLRYICVTNSTLLTSGTVISRQNSNSKPSSEAFGNDLIF